MPSPPVTWTSGGNTLDVASTGTWSSYTAIQARSTTAARGLYATTGSFQAVCGVQLDASANGDGVYGSSFGSAGNGVHGSASGSRGRGVYGSVPGSNARGVFGYATNSASSATSWSAGVYGEAWGNYSPGVYGTNPYNATLSQSSANAILGQSTGDLGTGVRGEAKGSLGRYGMYGLAEATKDLATGVLGYAPGAGAKSTNSTIGVWGWAIGLKARGVYGRASGALTARSGDVSGVYGLVNTTYGYGLFSQGDVGATGSKYFIQPHPTDASKSVQFVCLEGNENGTYFRGKTRLENRRAEIAIPREWKNVTAADGITVQVTPIGALAVLAAVEVTRDRIVIEGSKDCEFAYFVNGVRRGFEAYQPYIPNTAFRPEVKGVPFGRQFPKALRDILVRNGVLNSDYTPNEATAARLGWKLKDPEDVPVGERWWLEDAEREALIQASSTQPVQEKTEDPFGASSAERRP